jgi:hypothetical protein
MGTGSMWRHAGTEASRLPISPPTRPAHHTTPTDSATPPMRTVSMITFWVRAIVCGGSTPPRSLGC